MLYGLMMFFVFLVAGQGEALGHGSGGHGGCDNTQANSCAPSSHDTKPVTDIAEAPLQVINKAYLDRVKPVLIKKCGDCHGPLPAYPWYYIIPGVRQFIDYDRKSALKHLDISNDFPFVGHGTPIEDLRAVLESVTKGSMPPLRYSMFHKGANLTDEEKKTIMDWTADGEKLLTK
mgnify:CR=1 FL=1